MTAENEIKLVRRGPSYDAGLITLDKWLLFIRATLDSIERDAESLGIEKGRVSGAGISIDECGVDRQIQIVVFVE